MAAGIAIADALHPEPQLLLVGGSLALASGIALARSPRAWALAALALAWHAGALALALRLRDAAEAAAELPTERSVEATVGELRENARGIRVRLEEIAAVDGAEAPLPPRVLLLGEPGDASLRALPPGARLRARLQLRAPQPLRNPGGHGEGEGLTRTGIGALATLSDPRLLVRVPERDRGGLAARLHAPRRRAADRLLALGPGGALLAALALGDRSGLSLAHQDAFARLGLAHLLSVSGLHLVLAAGLAYGACASLLRRVPALSSRCDTRAPAFAFAVASSGVYALWAGFEVPVQRSFSLVVAAAVALATSRGARPFHPLAAAALWVLACEPQALFEAGPQLSFAASAALIAAARRAPPPAPGARARLAAAFRATAAASAATAPIAAWHGLPAAPLALFANALAVPWTGVALLPASLAAAGLAALPGGGPDLPLRAAAWIGDLSLDGVAWAARYAGPGSGVPPPRALCALAAAVAVAACRARDTRVLCAAALGLALLCRFAPPAPLLPVTPRLVALDVGAGDALLVQGRDAALLVDAGSAQGGRFDRGRDTVIPALRALGIARLDLLVATHADLDHRGGLPAVLEALPVGVLWLPAGSARDPGFADVLGAARAAGVASREISTADPPRVFGDLRVTAFWPPPGATGARNERSLGLRVETGAHALLLLGDLGSEEAALVERAGTRLRADVLVLPHHGSRGSSSARLLAAVSPEVAIVSAPCRGRLPHPAALQRAREAGASLWWTGRDGAVRVGLGGRLTVLPYASARFDCRPAGRS